MNNCAICRKPIVLIPSAADRAKKFGGKPSDYTSLFTAHATCRLQARDGRTSATPKGKHTT